LASITVEELQLRTEDYESAGIDVFWWFGRDAFGKGALEWSVKRYGFYFKVEMLEGPKAVETVLYPADARKFQVLDRQLASTGL
jgi:competence CoiA-like predicted nuclease